MANLKAASPAGRPASVAIDKSSSPRGRTCTCRRSRAKKKESACKPGSVENSHSSGTTVTSRLEQPTRMQRGPRHRIPIWPCFGWGLPCRQRLPVTRCALTAPFHPYRRPQDRRRFAFCCTFRGLAPPRRYLAPCPVKPGLSSTGRAGSDCSADSDVIITAQPGLCTTRFTATDWNRLVTFSSCRIRAHATRRSTTDTLPGLDKCVTVV